ncbi:MAG: hypothetical protein NTY99_01080 [DPANN group archaeon]|nr:hypothetical protein [DPANN group archaeon]
MGTGRAVLGLLTSGLALKSLADIVSNVGVSWHQAGAAVTAALYGLSEGRLGAGLSIYCGLSAINDYANGGNYLPWAVGSVFFAGVYGLYDNPRVKKIVEQIPVYIYKSDKDGKGDCSSSPPAAPSSPGRRGYASKHLVIKPTQSASLDYCIEDEPEQANRKKPKKKLEIEVK